MTENKKEDFDKKLDELSSKYGLKTNEEDVKNVAAESYMLGISLFSHTLIGLFIGLGLDKFLGTIPLFLLLFLLLGFISGFRHIWKNIK